MKAEDAKAKSLHKRSVELATARHSILTEFIPAACSFGLTFLQIQVGDYCICVNAPQHRAVEKRLFCLHEKEQLELIAKLEFLGYKVTKNYISQVWESITIDWSV